MQADHIADALKVAPPVTFMATYMAGFQWSVLSYQLATLYTALMIGHFLWTKLVRPNLRKRDGLQ